MNGRDELLRAHVYRAFDRRGQDGYDDAVRDVLDGWFMWPAVEYAHALAQARRSRDDTDRWIAEGLRDTRQADGEEVVA